LQFRAAITAKIFGGSCGDFPEFLKGQKPSEPLVLFLFNINLIETKSRVHPYEEERICNTLYLYGQSKVDDRLWHPTRNTVLRYYDSRCEITFRKKT